MRKAVALVAPELIRGLLEHDDLLLAALAMLPSAMVRASRPHSGFGGVGGVVEVLEYGFDVSDLACASRREGNGRSPLWWWQSRYGDLPPAVVTDSSSLRFGSRAERP